MKNSFFHFYLCGILKYIAKHEGDAEKDLKLLGADICEKIVLINDIGQDFDVDSLIFRIAYTILPLLYSTERMVEVSTNQINTYFLFENMPVFGGDSSSNDFIFSETIISGFIEAVFAFSGFKAKVTVYGCPKKEAPNRVVYEIVIAESPEE